MSSKGPQSPQEVKKMHKSYPRPSGLRFSTDPQNVLNFLKRSSKPSKSTEVQKRYSRRPQIPQKVINVLKVPWSAKVPQMVIKWSSQSPQNFQKTVLKRLAKSSKTQENAQKIPKVLAVLRPQLMLKISSKGQENAQKVPNVLRTQALKWSSNYSKVPQTPRILQRSSNDTQIVLEVLKSLSTF